MRLALRNTGRLVLTIVLALGTSASAVIAATTTAPAVGPNRNVAAGAATAPLGYQGEVEVAVNPENPQQIVAVANTATDDGCSHPSGSFSQAVFFSSDGGATWGFVCAPLEADFGLSCNSLNASVSGHDPALGWDDAGHVFLQYTLRCDILTNSGYAVVVASSGDGGATWSALGTVTDSWGSPNTVEERSALAIDRWPGSPYHGRLYSCWDQAGDERAA